MAFRVPGAGVRSNELHIPVDRRVHLRITSIDVIHSFWVPAFGIKQDAVPGRQTDVYLTATHAGTYPGMCAELCGLGHTTMTTMAVVVGTGRPRHLAEPGTRAGAGAEVSAAAAPRRSAVIEPGLPARRPRRRDRVRGRGRAGGVRPASRGGSGPRARLPPRAARLPARHRGLPLLADMGRRSRDRRRTTNTRPMDARATGSATSGSRPTTRSSASSTSSPRSRCS